MDPLGDAAPHLSDPDRKRRYVDRLFARVAPDYDRFTKRFSFGMDARWKRTVAELATRRVPPRGIVLDVACGTGDVMAAVGLGAPVRVVGLDRNAAMLRRARRRFPGAPLVRGDMTALPFPGGSLDVVTAAYGLRNAPALRPALREVARVLKPGGWLVTLDFFVPARRWWRGLYLWYLRTAGRLVGWWWHGDPAAYGYIADSLRAWMGAGAFGEALGRHGLKVEVATTLLGGGVAIHAARRA